jgi:ATP-dependent RNA helicase SUPV3L1/SUV3
MLLAAAERRLGKMLGTKAEELLAAEDGAFTLDATPGQVPAILWDGAPVATLVAGPSLLAPTIRIDRALLSLAQDIQKRIVDRLIAWMAAQQERHLLPLKKMAEAAVDPEMPPVVRAVFAQLADMGGIAARTELDAALAHVDKEQRTHLRKAGIMIGVLDIYHNGLLKPGAALWRMALLSARRDKPMLPLPPAGAVVLALADRTAEMGARIAGFRGFGPQQVRVDMAERMARAAHEAIGKGEPFTAASPQIVSLGLSEEGFLQLMRLSGFRPVTPPAVAEGEEAPAPGANWAFKGRQKPRPQEQQRGRHPQRKPQQGRHDRKADNAAPASAPAPSAGNAFAGLASLLGRNG